MLSPYEQETTKGMKIYTSPYASKKQTNGHENWEI